MTRILCIAVASILAAGTVRADDSEAGRNLAAACDACHAAAGANQGGPALLAGMPREALIRAMREFRTGKRPSTVMQQLAKGYTDQDVALIAAYFAAQPAKRP